MDALKIDAMYYKGIALEATGEDEKALDCFKEIYSVDIKYRDITQRIESSYKK